MSDDKTTTYKTDPMMGALYEALKKFRWGQFATATIGVGILDPEISAVYLAVEERMKRGHGDREFGG